MGTKVTIRQEDNVVILDLAGRFVDTLSIRAIIIDLLEKGTLNILVNLEKAKLIGNGTTGELVVCLKLVMEKGDQRVAVGFRDDLSAQASFLSRVVSVG